MDKQFVLVALQTSPSTVLSNADGSTLYFRMYCNGATPAVGEEVTLQSNGEMEVSPNNKFRGVSFSRRKESVRYKKLTPKQSKNAWEFVVSIGDKFFDAIPNGALRHKSGYMFGRFTVIEPQDIFSLSTEEFFGK